ncbi:MAG: N-acetylmuramoyl-L-alanine amidase [Ignavibacteriae bacterium]|nr:N-acetylmuramoyl-L-alanine amidase [Ignavibacteriota bacterium]
MNLRKIIIIAILTVVLIFVAESQQSIRMQFLSEQNRSVEISAIQKGATFSSAKSIADALRFGSRTVPESKQFEIQTKEYSLRLTAENPFVLISDVKNTTSMVQLPFEPTLKGNEIFVPVESFVKLLDDVTSETIIYDRIKQVISVGTVTKISTSITFDISRVTVEQKSNGYLLRIASNKRITDYESWTKSVDDGTWLYVTLPDAKANLQVLNSNKPGGVVKDFLVFQSPTSLQLTFKLGIKVRNTELMQAEGSNDILVAVHLPVKEAPKTTKLEETLERTRNRWKLDCIVIDAGHGGHDPGTIGVKKTKEKDVTLAVATKLGKLLEQNMQDVKIVYTRKTDTFIELYRRGQIANDAGGKLFISIHCNAARKKPSKPNGFEIYLLRPGKTEDAVHIAAQENEVVKLEENYEQRYQELTEEQFILVTMAQSAYVKYSEQFAGILQSEMKRLLPVKDNGVKQAGFFVLVGASMPNVLIETGYLSNKKEEQFLKSIKGQDQLAAAIYQGIKKYKLEYEKSLDEGASNGNQR